MRIEKRGAVGLGKERRSVFVDERHYRDRNFRVGPFFVRRGFVDKNPSKSLELQLLGERKRFYERLYVVVPLGNINRAPRDFRRFSNFQSRFLSKFKPCRRGA